MGEECASDLVSKLGEYLITLIGRQFGYVLRYKTYIEGLKTEVGKLEAVRASVEDSVNEARYDEKQIYVHVENWLESAAKKVEEAQQLLERGKDAKSDCFGGWIPNPVVRYPISTKVNEMTEDIRKLCKTPQDIIFQKVYRENTPIGIVGPSTPAASSVNNNEDVLKSRLLIMEDVIKALGDNMVSVIGVYGPGGVGKSKLLEDVKSRVIKENLFGVVVMAKAASNQNIEEIQRDISYQLGLKLINEGSALGRAHRLCKRLEADSKKNILIILDNLQKKLELNEVGFPCGYDNKVRGCKLLLSSRKEEVLCTDMGCDRTFHLRELEDGEARRLFERTLGNRVNDPDFETLVDGVVKNCGGLPLFIISLAKRLRSKKLAAWKNALDIEGSDFQSLVEQNYKDIKHERVRSLFLVCALAFGRISMADSLVYCMGLGLFEKFGKTIEKARDRLIEDLHSLQASSLLLESDNTEKIRMHDIVVEVAISIGSAEWNALVGKEEDCGFKEWSEDELNKCRMMSFPNVGIGELPEKLYCPNLRLLLLYENNPSLKIPDSFFESMEKLEVLDLSCLSITSLPSSMKFLEKLKSLCLDYCILEDVTVLGKLKGLQFLSLVDSRIARLPKEIGGLTKLRFLNLTGCPELNVIEPGVLGSLVDLEELYMGDSFDQWEAEDEVPRSNASLAELKKMKKLSTLYIAIPHSANLLRDLPFGKLNKHRIQIGDVWDWSGEHKESRTLKLKLDSSNLLYAEWVQRCLQRTQDLHLDGLQDGNDSVHDLCVQGFRQLKNLHIQNIPSLQYVIPSIENARYIAFTTLESLSLKNLNNLEKICRDCLAPRSFNKLKIVKVDNCGEIKHLFPWSLTRIFLQLEEIEISRCHLMQQIVAEASEDGDEKDDDPKVKSCKLRRLTLQNLPEMTSFCKTMDHSITFFDGQQVSLPRLESLTLSELPIKEIWKSQLPADVRNLKFLKVEDCAFLLSIIPSNLLMKLHNLEVIKVKRCKLLGEVFDLEGLATSEDVKILSQLTKLTLSDLPSLGCIWSQNPRRALCFQNLKALKVQNCDNLRFLFSSSMARALVHIKEIEIASCKLMEKIMDVQEEESNEAVTTDIIEFPHLASLSLDELMDLKTFSSGKYRIHCPSLTSLRISGCPKMMTFSSSEGKQQPVTSDTGFQQAFGCINSGLSLPVFFNEKVLFTSLEELKLSSMCELKRIWHNKLHEQSFCRLASLTIELCENLSHVFPLDSIDRLQSLNKIKVVGCCSLESLFEPVSLNCDKRQKPLVLSVLKKVKLLNLPKLRYILKSDRKVILAFPSLIKVNVRRCNSLAYLFSTATAKTLDNLKVLDVSSCNNLRSVIGMEEGKGKIIDTLKFHHLTTLKLGDLENLISFSSVSCASAGLHPLFDEKLEFPELEELQIKGIQLKELWSNKILVESFCQLKVLEVKYCHNLLKVIPPLMWTRLLHYIESLTVESCTLIKGIYTLEGLGVMEREATRNSPLRELSLCDLPNLTYIWRNEDLLNLCFHSLTSIRVEKCPRLRNLFTASMAKSLAQLQYLGLGGCGEMEYIVAGEEKKPKEVADIIVIPQLVTLHLHNMPKLRSFYHGKHISEWPSLKELTIEDCRAVKVIVGDATCRKPESSVPLQQPLFLVKKVEFPSMELMKISQMDNVEKIWPDELASNAFSKLKTLTVEYCDKLSSIFSSNIILARFENLEMLTVTDCNSLEVVFEVQEVNISGAHSTSYFQLRKLYLRELPKMKHVCSGLSQGALTLGQLRCIEAYGCNSLKNLFPSSVAKSMIRLEELKVHDCGVEEIMQEEDGGVGTSASDLFFPRLTRLELLDLPELRSFYKNSHTSTWPFLKTVQVKHCGRIPSEIQSCQGSTTSVNLSALFSLDKAIPHLKTLRLARKDVVMMQHYSFSNLEVLYLSCYHDGNDTFPSNFLIQRFPNLEALSLECSSFEEIFPEDVSGLGKASLKALGNLKRLWLNNLCNLRRVWKDGSLIVEILQQIEELCVWHCPGLSIVFPSPTSFQRLTELEVAHCDGLVHMGTWSAVTNMVHLSRLILRNCGRMKDVVRDDGNGVEEISFPKLEELILIQLPSLESFSPINCTFVFPSLVRVIVTWCPEMNLFCKGASRTPQLDEVLSEEDGEGCWEGDLNTTIQTLRT